MRKRGKSKDGGRFRIAERAQGDWGLFGRRVSRLRADRERKRGEENMYSEIKTAYDKEYGMKEERRAKVGWKASGKVEMADLRGETSTMDLSIENIPIRKVDGTSREIYGTASRCQSLSSLPPPSSATSSPSLFSPSANHTSSACSTATTPPRGYKEGLRLDRQHAPRAALLFLRPKAALAGKPVSVSVVSASDNKSAPPSSLSSPTQQQKRSSWGWGLITWDRLPSLPLSLSAKPVTTEMRGRGVGLRSGPSSMPTQQLQQQQPMQQVQSWQSRRGPAFERPLPAIYQTEVPASMAKMIMSRHTFRRPSSPRPSPRSSTPQVQIQKRTPSMV
ncbi:hypothetical protein BDQ17DRAFT_785130 [Cyathus striatus]|nr:hypothetical protein BDQ17DRAFT_785130 [Cyathus striatus]